VVAASSNSQGVNGGRPFGHRHLLKYCDVPEIHFDSVSPIVPVRNLDAALDRYRQLGFGARAYEGPERYGFVDRGSVSIHLTEWAEHDPLRTASSVYLYVSDADALHAEWEALEELEGRLIAPFDTPYRLREFVYVDPDGTQHRIGSRTA
jgi:hypothetical protein